VTLILTQPARTSVLKMEAARSSETLVSNYHTTRYHNPEKYEFLRAVLLTTEIAKS